MFQISDAYHRSHSIVHIKAYLWISPPIIWDKILWFTWKLYDMSRFLPFPYALLKLSLKMFNLLFWRFLKWEGNLAIEIIKVTNKNVFPEEKTTRPSLYHQTVKLWCSHYPGVVCQIKIEINLLRKTSKCIFMSSHFSSVVWQHSYISRDL